MRGAIKWLLIMDYELRIAVEKVAVSSFKICDVRRPASILELALQRSKQIYLLAKV